MSLTPLNTVLTMIFKIHEVDHNYIDHFEQSIIAIFPPWTTENPEPWTAGKCYQVRPKRKVLRYTVERPEPVREPLENGQEYWVAAPGATGFAYGAYWTTTISPSLRRLQRGLIYLTREDAEEAARAMLGPQVGDDD